MGSGLLFGALVWWLFVGRGLALGAGVGLAVVGLTLIAFAGAAEPAALVGIALAFGAYTAFK